MATGPEHYREAERLIQVIEDGNAGDTMLTVVELIGMAQVHATLAEAAATARAAGPGGMPLTDWRAWQEVAGVPMPEEPDEELAGEARCRVCGCTENQACEGGCHWVPDPQMGDLCSRCAPDTAPHWLAEILAQCDAGEITPHDGIAEVRRHLAAANGDDTGPAPVSGIVWTAYLIDADADPSPRGGTIHIGDRETPQHAKVLAATYLNQHAIAYERDDAWQPHGTHRHVLTRADGRPVEVEHGGRRWHVVVAERELLGGDRG